MFMDFKYFKIFSVRSLCKLNLKDIFLKIFCDILDQIGIYLMILNVGIVYVRFLFLMKFENSEIFDVINDS